MKNLFAFCCFVVLSALSAQAQTITINNPTSCTVYYVITYEDALLNTYTLYNKVIPGMTACYTPAGGGGCGSLSGTAPLSYKSINLNTLPALFCPAVPATSPCPNTNSVDIGTTTTPFPPSDCFEVAVSCNACASGTQVNGTWTDLTLGDVQVDLL